MSTLVVERTRVAAPRLDERQRRVLHHLVRRLEQWLPVEERYLERARAANRPSERREAEWRELLRLYERLLPRPRRPGLSPLGAPPSWRPRRERTDAIGMRRPRSRPGPSRSLSTRPGRPSTPASAARPARVFSGISVISVSVVRIIAGDRGGVLQRRARHLERVDDARARPCRRTRPWRRRSPCAWPLPLARPPRRSREPSRPALSAMRRSGSSSARAQDAARRSARRPSSSSRRCRAPRAR